jgi:hypothetical protein
MADFNIQPIATQIKPMQGMSLADMVNIARGAQAYQQAEQVNPLALQQQQQQTRTGEIALGVEEQKDKERKNIMTVLSDPQYRKNNRLDLDLVGPKLFEVAPLTAPTVLQGLTTLNKAQTEADAAISELNQSDRALLAQPLSVLGRSGVKDPMAYAKVIKETQELNKNNPRLVALGDSYLTQLQFADPEKLPDIAIKASQNLFTPAQAQTQLGKSIQVTPEGKTVVTQPAIGAAEPTATIGVAGGLQQNVPTIAKPIVSGTEVAPGMRVPYPVRRADQPYMAEPSEQKDQTAGTAFRERLVEGQNMLAQGRRNVSEVIQQANKINEALVVPNFLAQYGFEKGGAPEAAERAVRRFFGSEQYDMLAKDLANMAITNSKAMGTVGGTVAGLDMASVANGTIKVTPDILVKIARRVQADQTNLDMQASGAQKFFENYGDNNMKAFQQAWNANSKDTRVFEAMNLMETESDPEKLNAEFKKLFPSEKKRKTILKQYQNLKSMAATGVPVQPLTPEDF